MFVPLPPLSFFRIPLSVSVTRKFLWCQAVTLTTNPLTRRARIGFGDSLLDRLLSRAYESYPPMVLGQSFLLLDRLLYCADDLCLAGGGYKGASIRLSDTSLST